MKELIQKVCAHYSISENQLHSNRKFKDITEARMVIMWYCRVKLKWTLRKSADVFGKNHSTASNAVKRINNFIEYENGFKDFIDTL